jgi:hypothetical protein
MNHDDAKRMVGPRRQVDHSLEFGPPIVGCGRTCLDKYRGDSPSLSRAVGASLALLVRDRQPWDVANEMDQEDGLIWVYGLGGDGVMAFTDFGIETLIDLVEIYKADPDLLKRSSDTK